MLSDHALQKLNQLQTKALLAGIGGVAIALVGSLISAIAGGGIDKVFQPFLITFIFTVGLSVGCLAAVMLHHLCGGAWSFMIQRILEAASRTIPFVFIFGLIVMVGSVFFSGIYPWTSQEYLDAHHIVQMKTPFLNPISYTLGFLVYFGVWMLLMFLYNGWSKRLDETGDLAIIGRMQFWAGPGLMAYVVTVTLAGTHWVMSLEPEWFSTIFGAWAIAGFNITVISLSIVVLTSLSGEESIANKLTTRHVHHLGTFLCGFVIFWAYVSFCQFLLIWNANLPEETGWYLNRQGELTLLTVILMVFHWFVPMLLLFQRRIKKNPVALRRVAIYMLAMRVLDLYWNISPSFVGHAQRIGWVTLFLTIAAVIGIGGVWTYLFLGQLKKRPLLPVNDPRETYHFLKDTHHHHTEVIGHA